MVARPDGLGAFFLSVETPASPMHIGSVLVIEPGTAPKGRVTREDVANFFAARLHLAPPLRWRLVGVPLNLDRPVWAEDSAVDLDFHVRGVTLPPPGSRAQLAALAARLMGRRLDRRRPLWDAHVVRGLADGRVALITRAHHAAVDGVLGTELASLLFGSGDGPPPAAGPGRRATAGREPGNARLLAHAGVRMVGRSLLALRTAPGLARTLAGVRPGGGRGDPQARAMRPGLFSAPAQPWNGALGPRRAVGLAEVPLADVTMIRRSLRPTARTRSATVNDVLLAAVAAALRGFLEDRGAPVDHPVVAMVPVAVRAQGAGRAANRVSAVLVALPVDEPDPVARLEAVAARMADAKRRLAAGGPGTLPAFAELLPVAGIPTAARLYGLLRVADHHRPVWNTVVSNVPGPRGRLSVAGGTVEAIYPLGPLHEMNGLNITLLTYADAVFAGLNADRRLLPDVARIADRIPAAVAELAGNVPG